ncbi:MAG: alpha/beta hydrolase family protein [Gaiellaceae bacterium]
MRRALLLSVLAAAACGGSGEPAAEFTSTEELGSRTSVDVTFQSRGVQLRGRLDLPADGGPHPAVVWVHGSGDERLDDRSPVYTEHLDPRYAVFTYERSPKKSSRFEELAEDVVAAVKAVRSHDEIEADDVGLIALGVGGWITPIAADRSTAISFAVILSGPAVSVGEENLFEQLTGSLGCRPTGIPEAEILRRVNAAPPSRFDPRPYLARLDIPVLWLYGDRDTRQPVAKDLGVLKALTAEGKRFETVVFPKANHELLRSETGTCWEGRRGRRVVPGFGPALNRWLGERVG